MKTKLTLSIDEPLVQFAHEHARQNGTTISRLFSEYLVQHKDLAAIGQLPSARDLTGSLKSYAIDDSKVAIRNIYASKHLH